MDGSLTRQVQSKVSQILNKSKWAWKAFFPAEGGQLQDD